MWLVISRSSAYISCENSGYCGNTCVIIITMMNNNIITNTNNEVHAYMGVVKVWSRVKTARSLPGHARACSRLCSFSDPCQSIESVTDTHI